MKKILLLLFVAVYSVALSAQNYRVDFLDGKRYIMSSKTFGNLEDDVLFADVVLWALKNENTKIAALDYDKQHIEINCEVSAGTGKQNTNYASTLKIDVYAGIVKFRIEDIVYSQQVLVAYKNVPFEKLQPEKKAAHKTIIADFESTQETLMSSLFEYIGQNKLQKITHWKEIKAGKVVVGMNETEARLAVGNPQRVIEENQEIQWMMNTFFYIFFKNGIVSSVLK